MEMGNADFVRTNQIVLCQQDYFDFINRSPYPDLNVRNFFSDMTAPLLHEINVEEQAAWKLFH